MSWPIRSLNIIMLFTNDRGGNLRAGNCNVDIRLIVGSVIAVKEFGRDSGRAYSEGKICVLENTFNTFLCICICGCSVF